MEEARTFSFSQLQLYQECPRKYKYKYIARRVPKWDGPALAVGTAMHAGVAHLMNTGSKVEALRVALETFNKDTKDIYGDLDEKDQRDIDNGNIQLEAMMDRYEAVPGEPMAVEQEYTALMPNGDTLFMRVDSVVKGNLELFVVDTKSTGLQLEKALKAQRLRHQYPLYKFGLRQAGVEVEGVMIDMVGKPRVYWKKKGGVETGEHSVQDVLTTREMLHVGEVAIADAVAWFVHTVAQIDASELANTYPKNTNACLNFNRVCPYHNVCKMPQRSEQLLADDERFVSWEGQQMERGNRTEST